MSEVKIEKDIPMPKKKSIEYQEILKNMEVGDSFLIGEVEINQKLRSLLQTASRIVGCNITQKKDGDSLRVWKIS